MKRLSSRAVIGFATADEIAQKVGIPRDSINRAKAGIDHVLLEATSEGHCALPLERLKLAATKLLGVPEPIVEQGLSQMLTSGSLLLEEMDGEPLIFLLHLRRAEKSIAAKLKSLAGMAPLYPHMREFRRMQEGAIESAKDYADRRARRNRKQALKKGAA